MAKKFIYFFILISLTFCFPALTYAQEASVQLSSGDLSSLKPQETFTVDITVDNIDNLVGGYIVINYDSTLLQVEGKTLNLQDTTDFTSLEGITNTSLKDSEGSVLLVFGLDKNIAPLSGSQTIGTITFKALKKGSSTISIGSESILVTEDLNMTLNEVTFTSNSINYTVLGTGGVSGTITDSNNSPISNATVEVVKGESIVTTTADSNGVFNINNLVEGNYTLNIKCDGYYEYSQDITIIDGQTENVISELTVEGDVNNDCIVSLEDLVLTANEYGNTGNNSFDVNKDGIIDILDLIFINRRLTE
ncbi:carboxypeptidase regulatory-like domain-containing protein [Thermohalobacter berrensis]|uniref:Dockerin domain-containing protein n=1 Tax=Thermohalobacter berrensis TaxID=99594 RepID=A0A419T7T9_9FIRM|nr:carboxypeptidase regulatory-like domain-containing protein [Thermohalobacter berrensis]RKD33493.1 hypothetical protein BET03_08895 [Thermohalobacter berrensis]